MQAFEENPLTSAGVALGRQLFYDPILSRDSTRSCSSCHIQAFGFSDTISVSLGIENRKGKRNAIALTNLGYHYTQFFWDGRVASLEEQALVPVEDSLELGNTWEEVEGRMRQHPSYPVAFRAAFGIDNTREIDRRLVAKALAQFERTLISANSKFDKVLSGQAELTPTEERGRLIFFDESEMLPTGECAHCHVGPLLTTLTFFNNGLDNTDLALADLGLAGVSGNVFDRGKFKTPSLRNVALTAPYMHDGRFSTLEEVIEQYNKGGHYSKNESPNIRPLGLNEQDQADLIAFLHTLTDTSYLERQELSNPFLP
ncbi:MAG: c-type cytochrome [Saprospiraceae bacterium]|nr:c-type cytochrome [Saprospiraceae bacterium]